MMLKVSRVAGSILHVEDVNTIQSITEHYVTDHSMRRQGHGQHCVRLLLTWLRG